MRHHYEQLRVLYHLRLEKDFTDHLQYYFKNPDERLNARDYLKEKYSWDHMYKVLDQEFNNGKVRP